MTEATANLIQIYNPELTVKMTNMGWGVSGELSQFFDAISEVLIEADLEERKLVSDMFKKMTIQQLGKRIVFI